MRRITSSMSNGSFAPFDVTRRAAMTDRGGKNDARLARGSVADDASCAVVLCGLAASALRLDLAEQSAERLDDAIMSLAQQRREDVLADLLAP
jgi:hypothetical protein